jgi:hypothetical protein
MSLSIPGAYPLSVSPEQYTLNLYPDRAVSMSRTNTNNTSLSVNLPGAYPRERSRYNSSSSGLSSAASYRTAFDPETWDSEDARARDEQSALQQSLVDATRAMRALERQQFALQEWTSTTERAREKKDVAEDTLMDSPAAWPTPPYLDSEREDSRGRSGGSTLSVAKRLHPPSLSPARPPKSRDDYFRIGIPSPSER